MKYYLAIDLGATSGRHVVGYEKNGEIILEEIHRFRTQMDETKDGLCWNIPRIFQEIKNGIKEAFKRYPNIESLSIDSWGVDYVLMNNNKEIEPYYAYRNERLVEAAKKFHETMPFSELYKQTGIQFAIFNTIYQLYDDLNKGRLDNATDYLTIPCYFMYKLTGVKTHEYTFESTTSLLDPNTKKYDQNLINRTGLPNNLFGDIKQPGSLVGKLLPEIEAEVGGNTDVVLCATHDTGSAFEAVDCPEDSIILSSGTWSLFGVKSKNPICTETSLDANFSNEGGVGYIRFLKNIMGMWIVNSMREQDKIDFVSIIPSLKDNKYEQTFDVNDDSLMSPKNMKSALLALLKDNPPKDDEDLLNSVFHSMAKGYKNACDELERITGKNYSSIYVIGGGANNKYLNELIGKYTNKKIVAMPCEATSLGNIKVQMNAKK